MRNWKTDKGVVVPAIALSPPLLAGRAKEFDRALDSLIMPVRAAVGKIFICYRREDTGNYAGRIAERLLREFSSDQVFMDTESVRGGADWVKELTRELEQADAVLVVIGRQWLTLERDGKPRLSYEDDWVRSEIRTALHLHKPILPIVQSLRAVRFEASALPADIRALSRLQAQTLRPGSFSHDFRLLSEWLDQNGIRPLARARRTNLVNLVAIGAVLLLAIFVIGSSLAPPSQRVSVRADWAKLSDVVVATVERGTLLANGAVEYGASGVRCGFEFEPPVGVGSGLTAFVHEIDYFTAPSGRTCEYGAEGGVASGFDVPRVFHVGDGLRVFVPSISRAVQRAVESNDPDGAGNIQLRPYFLHLEPATKTLQILEFRAPNRIVAKWPLTTPRTISSIEFASFGDFAYVLAGGALFRLSFAESDIGFAVEKGVADAAACSASLLVNDRHVLLGSSPGCTWHPSVRGYEWNPATGEVNGDRMTWDATLNGVVTDRSMQLQRIAHAGLGIVVIAKRPRQSGISVFLVGADKSARHLGGFGEALDGYVVSSPKDDHDLIVTIRTRAGLESYSRKIWNGN